METTKKNANSTSTVKAPETKTPQVQAKKIRVYFDGPSPLENGKNEEEQKEYWIVKVAEDQEAMPRYIYRILTYGISSIILLFAGDPPALKKEADESRWEVIIK